MLGRHFRIAIPRQVIEQFGNGNSADGTSDIVPANGRRKTWRLAAEFGARTNGESDAEPGRSPRSRVRRGTKRALAGGTRLERYSRRRSRRRDRNIAAAGVPSEDLRFAPVVADLEGQASASYQIEEGCVRRT